MQIDKNILNLTKAIRQVESGGNPNAVGDAGTSRGAYQWQKGNFESAAQKYGLNPKDFSLPNQNRVAYMQVKELADKGYTPSQIAAAWNAGEGSLKNDAWKRNVGFNKKLGVSYDTPKYVENVRKAYQGIKSGKITSSRTTAITSQVPSTFSKDYSNALGKSVKETYYDPFAVRLKGIANRADDQSIGSTILQGAGALVSGGTEALSRGLVKSAESVAPETTQAIEKGLQKGAQKLSGLIPDSVKNTVQSLIEQHPEAAADLNALVDIASVIPAGKGLSALKDISLFGKEAKLAKTTGRITRGTTEDIDPAVKTLKEINPKGVKIYKVLSSSIQKNIDSNLSKVTQELSKDTKGYGLQDFTRFPGKQEKGLMQQADKTLRTNWVSDGMKSLIELAQKTKDSKLTQELLEFKKKLDTKTFTKNDVNELSKLMGQYKNAYSRAGELLKGTNAQAAENIREGLKDIAREGMSPDIAKLDKAISEAIKTKEVIDEMSEKVNKELQKASESGLIKKLVTGGVDIVDVLTGRIISTSLQRLARTTKGSLSAIEAEKELNKNLRKIHSLSQSGKTAELKKFLKGVAGIGTTEVINQVLKPNSKKQ